MHSRLECPCYYDRISLWFSAGTPSNKIVLSEGMLKEELPTDRSKVAIIGSVKVIIKY
jgi:hypothetical protein